MNKVYDNGYYLLGEVHNVIEYSKQSLLTSDMEETIYEIVEELKEYDDNDIVCIYYDNPMSYTIEVFKNRDIVYEEGK